MDLFSDNVDLVKKIVNKMNYGFVGKDDLMQAGLMGLFYAAKNYKPSFNVKFNTYATYYIIGEIKKELRENKLIKINKEIYRIIKAIKRFENLSLDEIANNLNTDKENVLLAYTYMNKVSSLNKENDNNELEMLEIIPDETQRKSSLYDALDSLDAEDKQIITLRYFKNYSQSDISRILKKTQSKVSRMESQALVKMRKFLLSK